MLGKIFYEWVINKYGPIKHLRNIFQHYFLTIQDNFTQIISLVCFSNGLFEVVFNRVSWRFTFGRYYLTIKKPCLWIKRLCSGRVTNWAACLGSTSVNVCA